MDDNYSVSATVRDYVIPAINEEPVFTESVSLTFSLAAGTSLTVPLTGLTAPKLLIVEGGKGITVKINSEVGVHNADPVFMETAKTSGMTISALVIANTDTSAHTIVVLAAE